MAATGDAAPKGPALDVPATGVVGLGDIGRGVSGTLAQAGIELTVCDVRPEATEPFRPVARVAATPAEVAAHCDVVLVAVVDDAQVRHVVAGPDGILSAGRSGIAVVVLSTVSIGTALEMAERAAEEGVLLVDCGVSGGPAAAASGELVCMVGGTSEAVDRVRPVLDVLGSNVLHMGTVGAGLSAKLARNLVQYGSWLAAYEAQVLAEAAGIPLLLLAEAIRESDRHIGGASRLMFRETARPLRADVPTDAGLIPPMSAGNRLAHKDLEAAIALAETLGVDVPLARLTEAYADRVFAMPEDPPDGGQPNP
jgi:3-hydroxyisobutyrate dehydrogenase